MAAPQPPSTNEVTQNIISQLEGQLATTIPFLPKSFERVLAKTIAGVFVLLYKYAGFIALQQFVKTASNAGTIINGKTINPLTEWGRLVGVGDPTKATNAQLLVTVTVLSQTGTLQSGESLINPVTGITYQTINAVNLDAATVNVTVKAVFDQSGGTGSGALGNMNSGETLTFARPLANVTNEAVVDSQVVTAANDEDVEVYRQRVIDRFQKRPQGGAPSDYELWSEEVAGILNVYPYKSSDCPGQVDVFVEATVASSGSDDGIPTTAQLIAVQDSIQLDQNGLSSRRPIGSLVNTFAITRREFAVNVFGVADVADLAGTEAAITTAINEYFAEREPFIVGLTFGVRRDRIVRSAIAGVVEDIVSSRGGIFSSVTVSESSTFFETETLGQGEKAKPGDIVFIQ